MLLSSVSVVVPSSVSVSLELMLVGEPEPLPVEDGLAVKPESVGLKLAEEVGTPEEVTLLKPELERTAEEVRTLDMVILLEYELDRTEVGIMKVDELSLGAEIAVKLEPDVPPVTPAIVEDGRGLAGLDDKVMGRLVDEANDEELVETFDWLDGADMLLEELDDKELDKLAKRLLDVTEFDVDEEASAVETLGN